MGRGSGEHHYELLKGVAALEIADMAQARSAVSPPIRAGSAVSKPPVAYSILEAARAADYLAGDIYHALAKMCGLTNQDAKSWKATPEGKSQRQRMKALQLGVNYGMGVMSLSRGLGRHPLIGSQVIIRHQQRYQTYWDWRRCMVERAMLERVIVSEFDGWPLHISTSPNKRTLYNFPMQSGGAEMLLLAANRLCDADLVPIMLVHDGILFELDNE